jgi:hypothetical protein
MDELRVPKRRVAIEIAIAHDPRRSVVVFLSEFASHHAGAERVSDLLNGSAEFLPALDPDGKRMTFYNRAGILFVRVDPAEEPVLADAHTIPTEHEVELTLSEGSVLRGLVSYVLPPDRARVIDFLNEAPQFFRVLEPDRATLVNKRHVAQVVALDG